MTKMTKDAKENSKKKVAAKPMTDKGNFSSKTSEPKNEDMKNKAAAAKAGPGKVTTPKKKK